MNKWGFLEQVSPPPLPNPPPLFPFLPILYPLPLSTPATQANLFVSRVQLRESFSKKHSHLYSEFKFFQTLFRLIQLAKFVTY